jgi:hypothetical protein
MRFLKTKSEKCEEGGEDSFLEASFKNIQENIYNALLKSGKS